MMATTTNTSDGSSVDAPELVGLGVGLGVGLWLELGLGVELEPGVELELLKLTGVAHAVYVCTIISSFATSFEPVTEVTLGSLSSAQTR